MMILNPVKKLFQQFQNQFILSICLFFLALILNTGCFVANSKSTKIKLNLSGKSISFASPVNYSKDYPRPLKTEYKINIYDKALYENSYTDAQNYYEMHKSYWDYGRNLIFGSVKGTLSMGVLLYHVSNDSVNIENDFLLVLKEGFNELYSEQDRDDFDIDSPKEYKMKTISVTNWGYYEYSINGSRNILYALPLSDLHYLIIKFNFINNSEGKKNNWKEQAQKTVDFIMSSFQVN